VCVYVGFLMCWCVYVWVLQCVGWYMYGYFDNCAGVLVICVLVFTVFCIDSFMYFYSYLLLA
jgi:hypothetical protein